jgi:ribosomal protein L40E
VITIDLICEACGEANPPGTEFCRNCNQFLGWDSTNAKPQPSTTTPTVSTAPVVEQPVPIVEQTVPSLPPVEQPTADQPYGGQQHVNQGYGPQPSPAQSCPYCGTVNPPTRRFCAHCGYSFVAEYGTDPSVDWSGWTPQAIAARDREAARAYRRSLPPLYRWRRVIIAVVVFALFVGLGALLRNNPVALAQDGWHRVNNDFVTVAGVQVQVEPTDATVPGSDPRSLIDGTEQEWTMAWAPTGSSNCGAAPGTGTVIFTFQATRIRRVVIAPGLAATNAQRPAQPRPAAIGLSFDGGPCHTETLADDAKQQVITIDSDAPVTQLRLGIGLAHLGGASNQQISLTEVWLQTYPSR